MLEIHNTNKIDKSIPNTIAYVVKMNDDNKQIKEITSCVSFNEKSNSKDSIENKNQNHDYIILHDSHKFQVAPRPLTEKERMTLFIAGEAGAGKSHYVREYAIYYHKMFPKNPIYLISYLDYDETLDAYDQVQRIKAFTPEFLDECMKIDLEEFRDSFVIFDDIDSISNKHIKSKIYALLAKMLRIGRHYNISVAYVGHELYASHELKAVLNESQQITWFPKFLNHKKIKYLLEEYFGLSKEQIQTIISVKNSRYITYCKGSSKIIISEHQMFIL